MSLPTMPTNPYRDLSTTELEAVLIKLHDESDAHIAGWEKKVAEARARAEEKKRLSAMDKPSVQQRVAPTATEIMAATQKLSQTELELKVAKHNATKMAEDYKRLEAKHLHAEKIQIRLKNENRILNKTIASLTTDLEATAARVESDLQIENDDLRKEIAQLRSELKHQTEECQAKDTTIAEMKQDKVAFQEFMAVEQESDSQNFLHRHDACNEMEALLREQAYMDSLRFADLEEKMEVIKAERDDLHNKLKAVHESFSIQCSGTWDCTSCVPHSNTQYVAPAPPKLALCNQPTRLSAIECMPTNSFTGSISRPHNTVLLVMNHGLDLPTLQTCRLPHRQHMLLTFITPV